MMSSTSSAFGKQNTGRIGRVARAVLGVSLLSWSLGAHAAGWSDRSTPGVLFIRGFDGMLTISHPGGNWGNPDGCASSDIMLLPESDPRYDDYYAGFLAALHAKARVRAWLDGCVSYKGSTYPRVANLMLYSD